MALPKASPNEMLDIPSANNVEISIRSDGRVLWINLDNYCAMRISQISDSITIYDDRQSGGPNATGNQKA